MNIIIQEKVSMNGIKDGKHVIKMEMKLARVQSDELAAQSDDSSDEFLSKIGEIKAFNV